MAEGWRPKREADPRSNMLRRWLVGAWIVIGALLVLSGVWVMAESRPCALRYEENPGSRMAGMLTAQVNFDPSYLELSPGETVSVDIMIHNVTDLYGFELHLSFDPSVVQIVDRDPLKEGINVTPGDFITPDFVPVNACSNITGTIDLSVTQVAREPHSGEGVLASITFMAVAPGDAAFHFESVLLSNQDGLELESTQVDPSFLVLAVSPTAGPSPTASVTPSPSPTPTLTYTPTLGPSPTTAATPYYYLDPQVLELGPGEVGTVTIRTSHVEGLGGVEVYLLWDPSILEVVDADPSLSGVQLTPGDLFEGHNTFRPWHGNEADNAAGRLSYVLSLVEASCLTGEWSVATITFRAVGSGTSSLTFGSETMMACGGLDLPIGWINGEVRVVTATSTPTTVPTQPLTPTATLEPTLPPPTVAPTLPPTPTCWDLIENGGFEGTSLLPWQVTGAAMRAEHRVHSGNYSLWLGGYNNANDSIAQTVTIPTGVISATVQYWWLLETTESDHPHDYLYVELRSPTGALLDTLQVIDDGRSPGVWLAESFDVSSWAGQTVKLVFRAETNADQFSSFFIDDVVLEVCASGPLPPPAKNFIYFPLTLKAWMPG